MDHLDSQRRFESLDALRAVACFLVIWQHVSESLRHIASGGIWTGEVADHFNFGRIGVVAFFCISGFVIPSSLAGPRLKAIRRFAINRFYRLFPPYWAAIGLAIPVYFSLSHLDLTPAQAIANLGMVAIFFDQPHIMGLFWTLEVELVFYFASAGLYLIFGDRKFVASLVGFAVSFLAWKLDLLNDQQGNLPIYAFFLSIMFSTAMARCLYDQETGKNVHISRLKRFSAWAVFGGMTFLLVTPLFSAIRKSFLYENQGWSQWGWGHFLGLALFTAFFLLGKSPRWLSVAGRWTYSAYLLHAIVFELLGRFWTSLGLPPSRMEILISLSTVLTFGIAYLAYRYIEAPFIRIGKTLANKPT